ncbi:indolepyruvate ferredoxin oxidoreductase beta subunit [Ruminiclostridium sufflavum DSM 19573]|uniref:Indolepyruvate ferredoxin oxidoreductase subunit beta n=1 Tax=Ruminiclostridium sufflavum DSM 19573 TaxID=1121337 RepID=A0A318XIN3_9FIRM|nr:indolepyruvate oxidoreductase subunit beta [Ruminiclostridium sufflavum]PYG87045.1 indolepyruvate ferredoxin oxidoreductase beta subunit [Ruminiclostridium sufflavum DSM 19573]
MEQLNILIVGVGGQGTLLASRILGNVALKMNYDVKVSEVHGMSQRGGSVVTYVKFGKKVYSPLVDIKEADVIMAFEKLEALRYIERLSDNGKMIVNEQQIDPMPVIIGKAEYPENIIETLKEKHRIFSLDALKIAQDCGNIKAVNIVLIGVLAKLTGISKEIFTEAIREVVPAKFLDINLKAFEEGYNYHK